MFKDRFADIATSRDKSTAQMLVRRFCREAQAGCHSMHSRTIGSDKIRDAVSKVKKSNAKKYYGKIANLLQLGSSRDGICPVVKYDSFIKHGNHKNSFLCYVSSLYSANNGRYPQLTMIDYMVTYSRNWSTAIGSTHRTHISFHAMEQFFVRAKNNSFESAIECFRDAINLTQSINFDDDHNKFIIPTKQGIFFGTADDRSHDNMTDHEKHVNEFGKTFAFMLTTFVPYHMLFENQMLEASKIMARFDEQSKQYYTVRNEGLIHYLGEYIVGAVGYNGMSQSEVATSAALMITNRVREEGGVNYSEIVGDLCAGEYASVGELMDRIKEIGELE